MFSPVEMAVVAGLAVLLFGAEKLPKLARSAGQAKKEFLQGQEDAKPTNVTPADAQPTTNPENHTPNT